MTAWRSGFYTRSRPDLHWIHGIELDITAAVGIQPIWPSAIKNREGQP
jgi:hypothetical protein